MFTSAHLRRVLPVQRDQVIRWMYSELPELGPSRMVEDEVSVQDEVMVVLSGDRVRERQMYD